MTRNAGILLIVLVAVLIGSWAISNYERVPSSEYVGWQGEARFNDFFAAELLLEELDIDSDSQATLKPSQWLPDSADTIVTQLSAAFSGEEESLLLTEWVENGGHLILLPPPDLTYEVEDYLATLGFSFYEVEDEEEQENEEAAGDEDEEDYDYLVNLDLARYRISDLYEDDSATTVSDDFGAIVMRRELGNGVVTVVSSEYFFTKSELREADHARLLLDIVAGEFDSGQVWFIYSTEFAPLWALIWAAAPAVVLSAALLIVLWLWSVIPRFGPRRGTHIEGRRSIIEHMSAAGRFMWKKHGAKHLCLASTQAVIRSAERTAVGIGRKSRQEQAQLIARITGQSPQFVLDAINATDASSHREFTQQIQRLQQLRKKL